MILSFDVRFCHDCNNNDDAYSIPVSTNNINDNNNDILMTKKEKNEYINKLLTEYYKNPKRKQSN